jgi:uncharacterized protein (TIGR02145 family)
MFIKHCFILFIAFTISFSQNQVNISGVVKNSQGSGIEGVLARLGKADIATTTGTDGSFRLTDDATGVKHQTNHTAFGNDCPFIPEDNKLFFSGAKQAEVKVMIYDCNGKLLFSHGKVASSRNHSVILPHFGNGIHIYRVFMNNEQYAFKSVAGMATNRSTVSSWKEIGLAKQAKATARIDDALLFTKAGYQLFRLTVTKPDTSGIQITMVPLVTGTVTDAEGNVYQTVRIGNQEWTAENLRATKYNNGASIGSAYHFYNNTTDAAAKKKWGALYNWDAVKSGKLAPTGWHVATDAEWDTMQNYLIAHGYNYDGTTSGNKIAKSMATKTDWPADTEDEGAIGNDVTKNNAGGFSAIPAGYRYYDGTFTDQGNIGYWWTATERDASYAWYRYLWDVDPFLSRGYRVKTIECSVRLVRTN